MNTGELSILAMTLAGGISFAVTVYAGRVIFERRQRVKPADVECETDHVWVEFARTADAAFVDGRECLNCGATQRA